uniref:E3 ubiquitin-protein ligase n=1 Tax=Macrostomum lignano TaxID=282301 RepID=A0A1I8H9E7_9PLAT
QQQQQQVESSAASSAGESAPPQPPSSCSGCSPARLFTPLDSAGLDRLAAAWLAAVSPPQRRPIACLTDRLALPSELQPPRLIPLPPAYDAVFSANRSRACRHCDQRPAHPAVCLVCGEFLCFNSPCCQARHGEDTVGECHRHSVLCGAGHCPVLVVDSSFVWVFTHGLALRWGSLYVDEFGEEDEELRRGKPLYLSQQRYQALEWQWLLHNYYSSASRLEWLSHSL